MTCAPTALSRDEIAFLTWLVTDNGYRDIRPLPGGRYAAIQPLAFTHALVVGRIGDMAGYDNSWCYGSYRAAKDALDAWDGVGEPAGWHRNPSTGRRRGLSPDERDRKGQEIGAAGVEYHRP